MPTVVHLPFYDDNSYQSELMRAQQQLGWTTIRGGGGGTFGRTALTQWKPDILHFHWLHPYLLRATPAKSLAAFAVLELQVRALKLKGTKVVWTAHNIQSHESPFPRLERRLVGRFLRGCDALIAHCEGAKTEVARTFGVPSAKIAVVPHASYIGVYPHTLSQAEARAALSVPPGATVFAFVGQIRPYKGVLELIEAWKTIAQNPQQNPAPLLLIAGKVKDDDGPIRAALEDLPSVQFSSGFVPDDELQLWLGASDAVVFPYRDILTSGAVLLAMSFGRAAIAPRRGCLAETLGEAGGILYDPDAPNALARALQSALSRRAELARMGQNNFERAKTWTWPEIAHQTNEVYLRVGNRKEETENR